MICDEGGRRGVCLDIKYTALLDTPCTRYSLYRTRLTAERRSTQPVGVDIPRPTHPCLLDSVYIHFLFAL